MLRNKSDIEDFVKFQLEQGFRPKTINQRLYASRAFYGYLREEVERLFHIIDNPKDQALFGLMLFYGLRVSKVTNLEFHEVNLFSRQLCFMEKEGWNEQCQSQRIWFLPSSIAYKKTRKLPSFSGIKSSQ